MGRTRSLALHASLALALVLVGGAALPGLTLAGASPSPSAEPSAPAPSLEPVPSVAPLPSLAPVPPSTVSLLSPGRRPRAERRLRYVAGQRETLGMRMTQVLTSEVDGTSTTVALPPIEYRFAAHVVDVDEAGVATLDMEVTSVVAVADPSAPQFDDALLAELNTTLATIVGLRVVTRVDDRGITLAAATDTAGIDPAILAQLGDITGSVNQLAAPLPEEPIGVGARWVTRGTAVTGGITFRTKQTSTLRRASGDTLRITVQGTQTGIPGRVDLPALPAGFSATLVALAGTIAGTMTVDLTSLVPVSRAEGTITVDLTATDGTTTQQVRSIADSVVVVGPAEE